MPNPDKSHGYTANATALPYKNFFSVPASLISPHLVWGFFPNNIGQNGKWRYQNTTDL